MKHRTFLALAVLLLCFVPGISQDPPYYFALITDTQMGMHASDRNFEQETVNYEFAVGTINRLKPEFVVILGDLVNKDGDPGQIGEFLRISHRIDPSIPVYYVAGNHDVGRVPTPESLAAYRDIFGPDYYSFRRGPVYGIVLNSSLLVAPQMAEAESAAQLSWLKSELEKAKSSGAGQTIVFQHHPFFVKEANEEDAYMNVPLERRKVVLDLLHDQKVRYVFAGHIHSHSVAKDGEMEMIAVGPVAIPFGEHGSGVMLAAAAADGVEYRYFDFGKIPNTLSVE
jgi:3',5'-cyclic AMP phosphodiesterase CpdA